MACLFKPLPVDATSGTNVTIALDLAAGLFVDYTWVPVDFDHHFLRCSFGMKDLAAAAMFVVLSNDKRDRGLTSQLVGCKKLAGLIKSIL